MNISWVTGLLLACWLSAGSAAWAQVGWREFVAQLRPEAVAAGVSESAFDKTFAALGPDCKQPGVTCPGEKPGADPYAALRAKGLPETCLKVTQKEFLRPGEYFSEDYLNRLAVKGRELLAGWRATRPDIHRAVMRIEAQYGVDLRVLLALWGRETSFGEFQVKYNPVRALASLAFGGAPSRRPWARVQTIAALKILSEGRVAAADFKSSWAGATGLTQVLPTEYLELGVDGDGDGRIDVWKSIPDALATTANILKKEGWRSDQRTWGVEVTLNGANADCTLEGLAHRKPVSAWSAVGVRPAQGKTALDPQTPGHLIMPGGATGPAFLVTDNFEVLRRYNTSDVYSVFIGTLAERIGCAGAPASCGFTKPWSRKGPNDDYPFSVENLCRLQIALKEQGFSETAPDGLFGRANRIAIGLYQKSRNRRPGCYPSVLLHRELTRAEVVAETPRR
jgi:lytic murein transglycosylase